MKKRVWNGTVTSYHKGQFMVRVSEKKLHFDVREVVLSRYGDFVVRQIFEGEEVVIETAEDGGVTIHLPVLEKYWFLATRMADLLGSTSVQDAEELYQLFLQFKQQQEILGEQRFATVARHHKELSGKVREYLGLTPSVHSRLTMDVTTIRPGAAASLTNGLLKQPVTNLGHVLVLRALEVSIRYILAQRADYDVSLKAELQVALSEIQERLETIQREGFEGKQEQMEYPIVTDFLSPGDSRQAVCVKWRKSFGRIKWFENDVPYVCRVHYRNIFFPAGRYGERRLEVDESVTVYVDEAGQVIVRLTDVENLLAQMDVIQPFLERGKSLSPEEVGELVQLTQVMRETFERIPKVRSKQLQLSTWVNNTIQRAEKVIRRSS